MNRILLRHLSGLALIIGMLGMSTVSTAQAPAKDDPIQAAVRKGVRYLLAVHQPNRGYNGGSHGIGSATLAGMALLESGVEEKNPAIQNIANFVRNGCLSQTRTYEISLCIMFLDRLGRVEDRPLIQFLGVRLMGGQLHSGSWSYDCGNEMTPQQEQMLRRALLQDARLVSEPRKDLPRTNVPRPDLPSSETPKTPPKPEPKQPEPDLRPQLHPEVGRILNNMVINAQRGGGDRAGEGDNSNTQFATLGLWVARKHGVPVEGCIALLEKRFRMTQDADGGWGYSGRGSSTAPMTCAGLLGLAVAHGVRADQLAKRGKVDAAEDPQLTKGLKLLGDYIGQAKGMPAEGLAGRDRKGRKRFRADQLNSNLYFLWSLERVAVIYGLETIGNHDWYLWGSDALVDNQAADGSWVNSQYHGSEPDLSTSFALLFLNRANIARDLTTSLKGKVKDPGLAMLRGGGDLNKILPGAVIDRPMPKVETPRVGTDPSLPTPMPNPSNLPEAITRPEGDYDMQVARMVQAVLAASGAKRRDMLNTMRDSKGAVYTESLARVCDRLEGDAQKQVRDALAKRLTRMTAATLRGMLGDTNREIRRAAAYAVAMKEERSLVPDLINTLNDKDPVVAQAARTALRNLTSRDFGPEATASDADRTRSVLAWRSWWQTQSPK